MLIQEVPNIILQHLRVVLFDIIVMYIGKFQPYQWTMRIRRNGSMIGFKMSNLLDIINYYSLCNTSHIDTFYFKDIKSNFMILIMLKVDDIEICNGFRPGKTLC